MTDATLEGASSKGQTLLGRGNNEESEDAQPDNKCESQNKCP